MKIQFTKGYKVRQGDGKGPEYAPGDVVDFKGPVEETYAHKYIRIGVAVEYAEVKKADDRAPAGPRAARASTQSGVTAADNKGVADGKPSDAAAASSQGSMV